jgi:hypothetical protein
MPHSPHHVSIYDDDWRLLQAQFGKDGVAPMGVSEAIREIVNRKCNEYRAMSRRRLDQHQEEPQS